MSILKFNIHNRREGILTIFDNKNYFTCISDQQIVDGDIILHVQYSKILPEGVRTFVVKKIHEERPSKGDWGGVDPSTWRKIEYTKELIPTNLLKEAGFIRGEMVTENGKTFEKIFFN